MVDMEMYNSAMEVFGQILSNCSEKEFDEFYPLVSNFQEKWMKKLIDDMPTETEAQRAMKECFWYAVTENYSGNGSSIVYDILSAAHELEELCSKYSDYADFKVYEDNNGTLTLDAVFYGFFVPDWDGWREE